MRTISECVSDIKSILNIIEMTEQCDGETVVKIDELANEILSINGMKDEVLEPMNNEKCTCLGFKKKDNDMVCVKDILNENQEEKDTIYIHLRKEKSNEYDPLIVPLWNGWLRDIPVEFMESEVKSTGQSLADLENGFIGFYIEIKELLN